MRNLVPCTFEAGTRTIHIPLHEMTGVENIRLIVNETQKVVICSSMQKDNITSCVKDNVNGGWDVTYKNDIPALASGDALTVEIDLGLGDKFYIDGMDLIMKAKLDGPSGTPFSIGPELAKQILQLAQKNKDSSAAYLLSKTAVEEFILSSDIVDALVVVGGTSVFDSICAGCTQLRKVDLSAIYGAPYNSPFLNAFKNCPSLESVDLSNLPYGNVGSSSLQGMFDGDDSITTMRFHPSFIYSDRWNNQLCKASIVHLSFSADVTNSISLQSCPLLDADSVKNVLEHCANTNMNGKTITFYSGGLTVQDDADGTIQTPYNTVVDTYGANIANLNITPYSA